MGEQRHEFLRSGVAILIIGVIVFVASQLLFSLLSDGIASDMRRFMSGIYFTLWTGFSVYYFRKYLWGLEVGLEAILTLLLFLPLLVLFYSYLPLDVLKDIWVFQHGPDLASMDKGGYWYVFEKSTEIAFQQVLIAVGIIVAYRYIGSLFKVAVLFSVFFALAHFSQFVDHTVAWVLTGVIAGAISGVAIPYLILRVRSGIVYAFILHWAFYVSMAVWFLYV